MKHKATLALFVILSFTLSLSLTACNPFKGYGQEAGANGKSKRFKDARGGVSKCTTSPLSADTGNSYLQYHGLPLEIKGNFACKGDIPVLPKDCQGREFRSEAELRVFWEKHQLPVGIVYFGCANGKPYIPAIQLEEWKKMERVKPTCKDERGRKRPCV